MTNLDDVGDAALLEWFEGVVAQAASRYPMDPIPQPYGPAPEQVIDWWGDPEADVVVASIHGGYFAAEYDRSVNEPISRRLAAGGYLVANLDYRRAGSTADPAETVDDVRTAIGLVVDCAGPGRPVIVLGHSAGGYLTLAGSTVPGVSAVIPLSPATSLAECSLDGWDDGAIAGWIGCEHAEDPDRWDRMELATVGVGQVPTTIIHGEDDSVVPLSQSEAYAAAASGAELVGIPTTGHYEFLDPQSEATALVEQWIRRLSGTG